MEPIDYWKLSTEYSVVQAALLTCGHDPAEHQFDVEGNATKPAGYSAVRSALHNAILSGNLQANTHVNQDDFGNPSTLDLHQTKVHVADLARFLKSSGFSSPVFDRPSDDQQGASDGPAYPPKLAAANKAWATVTANPSLLIGKSPKQALKKWLSDNAAELQLLSRDRSINRTGIEEICKVANWKPSGGATPTPSLNRPSESAPLVRLPDPKDESTRSTKRETYDLNDDIPF
ncbi:hypothetical protein [Brevundimonas sp. TWP2-3-4b1]|uniref:hypothetical protein n=1 Tax=Brevundimonas sp. TWP2-3-4b1 TaxID=2804580 RepID=UPI003CE6B2F2